MKINRKNALKLWKSRYGKQQKVNDFSGRVMAMGSYGDLNSKFGWNLDHIVPLSQNGNNEEDNLICCHIKTNTEKGNKYPGFNANGKNFNVIKIGKNIEIAERKFNKAVESDECDINSVMEDSGDNLSVESEHDISSDNIFLDCRKSDDTGFDNLNMKKFSDLKDSYEYSLGLAEGMVKTVLALKSCGKTDREIAEIIVELKFV